MGPGAPEKLGAAGPYLKPLALYSYNDILKMQNSQKLEKRYCFEIEMTAKECLVQNDFQNCQFLLQDFVFIHKTSKQLLHFPF